MIRTLPSVLLAPTMSALVSDRAVDASLRATLVVPVLSVAGPMFEPLPLATIEELASGLGWQSVEPGTKIIVTGEPGDRFYIVADGAVDVIADGRGPARLGRDASFGEVALLRDVPPDGDRHGRGSGTPGLPGA